MAWFYDTEDTYRAGIGIYFGTENIRYILQNCMRIFVPFSTSPPSPQEKVWVIKKRGIQIAVSCNGKIVLDNELSSTICDDPEYSDSWNTNWSQNVGKVRFPTLHDTATDFYHIGTL